MTIDRVVDIWANREVEVRCYELGRIRGRTRWRRSLRIGIEFEPSTNTTAKLHAFSKFFFNGNDVFLDGVGLHGYGAEPGSGPHC